MTFTGRLVLWALLIFILAVIALELGSATARRVTTGGVLFALLLVVGLSLAVGRRITSHLAALTTAARDIAAGTPPRLPQSTIPEVEALVEALRQLHREQADRFARLQQENSEGSAMVAAMGEGIIASDARGRIVIANPAARRLLGYGAEESLPDLRTLFREKLAREAVDEVLAGTVIEDRELDFDGQVISLNARSLTGGGAVLVLHDLTQIRRLEAIRRDFVANVSHELKTPLTSISGYADTLAEGGVDAANQRRFLETIRSNALRMHRLVDDLLDLSRVESGRWLPRSEPTSVGVTAREAFAMVADQAAQGGVTLAVDIGAEAEFVYCDAAALGQILSNLIDNSLRYTPRGGTITAQTMREGTAVTLSVRDTGSGIPGEHLDRIFERFYRAEPSRSREEGGTGLGLAIVKHLVEAHGGDVGVESGLGEGTAIWARFPDAAPDVTAL